MCELESLKARKLSAKAAFSKMISSPIYLFSNLLCYSHDITYFHLFSYTFLFFTPFLSFLYPYRTLYNLYLNPNLLKILSNYIYTIPKVITLHIYILTSCLIFFTHFYLSILLFLFSFIHFYLLYFSFMHFHLTFLLFLHIVLLCPIRSYYIWLFHITLLTVNIASYQATVFQLSILLLLVFFLVFEVFI